MGTKGVFLVLQVLVAFAYCASLPNVIKVDDELVGGQIVQDPNEQRFRQLAEESLQNYLQNSGKSDAFEVVQVVRATTQVVAGLKTRIEFVASSSDATIRCNAAILEQAWLNVKDINVDCRFDNQVINNLGDIVGGQIVQDPTAPRFRQLAEESLQSYLQNSGKSDAFEVVQVVRATTQVVAGLKTRIEFVASSSDATIRCNAAILEQAWLNVKDINVDCRSDNNLNDIVGGQTIQDPTAPQFRQLAEESLQTYLQNSGRSETFVVVQVVRATTQVVAGLNTRIEFVASSVNSGDTLICNSSIWEKVWMDWRDFTVNCSA